jgi:hypothetical protein
MATRTERPGPLSVPGSSAGRPARRVTDSDRRAAQGQGHDVKRRRCFRCCRVLAAGGRPGGPGPGLPGRRTGRIWRRRTQWLAGSVARDQRGFILTGPDLPTGTGGRRWHHARRPLPLETSLPGVFAADDVRHGSVKRVASAVGEGAATVPLIHRFLHTAAAAAAKAAAGRQHPPTGQHIRGRGSAGSPVTVPAPTAQRDRHPTG